MEERSNYKNELLDAWEETYKKGQLTLWVFLALKERPRYVDEIKKFVADKSNGTISCEEQSLYRTLRKYKELDIVAYEQRPGQGGPERKYYYLTELGTELLHDFIERNIKLFFKSEIMSLIS